MEGIKTQNDEKIMFLLKELKNELQEIYGQHLKDIILYGSYARGESNLESDMDIMVLVDLDNGEQEKYRNILAERVTNLTIKYDILISVIDNNYGDFNIRAPYVPFYKNVIQEGVKRCFNS